MIENNKLQLENKWDRIKYKEIENKRFKSSKKSQTYQSNILRTKQMVNTKEK